MKMIAKHSGIKLVHVPFKSSPEMHAALLGGHVMLSASGSSAKPLERPGKCGSFKCGASNALQCCPRCRLYENLDIRLSLKNPLGLLVPREWIQRLFGPYMMPSRGT